MNYRLNDFQTRRVTATNLNFDFSSSQRIQEEKELSDSSANIETIKTFLQSLQLR